MEVSSVSIRHALKAENAEWGTGFYLYLHPSEICLPLDGRWNDSSVPVLERVNIPMLRCISPFNEIMENEEWLNVTNGELDLSFFMKPRIHLCW